MSRSPSWKPVVAGVLLGATLALSTAALAALGAQAGPLMWSRTIGFAGSHDKRAFQILEAETVQPAALSKAALEGGRALTLSPYDNAARLRLAYVDARRQGSLKGEGLARFAESYDLVPYDHTVAAWRIRYGLEHWSRLTPELRGSVQAEAMAFGRVFSADVDVRQILASIRDPEGRVAAALWLRALTH